MTDVQITCPFTRERCSDTCGLSVWVGDRSACAIAVTAVRGTDHGINSVNVEHDRARLR